MVHTTRPADKTFSHPPILAQHTSCRVSIMPRLYLDQPSHRLDPTSIPLRRLAVSLQTKRATAGAFPPQRLLTAQYTVPMYPYPYQLSIYHARRRSSWYGLLDKPGSQSKVLSYTSQLCKGFWHHRCLARSPLRLQSWGGNSFASRYSS